MGDRYSAMRDELRIIRAARRNGRGRCHPSLLHNPVTDAREEYLVSVLLPAATPSQNTETGR